MAILNYELQLPVGYEGMIATVESFNGVIRTASNADTIVIPFGRAVVRGTGDGTAIMPSAGTGQILLGVATKTDVFEKRIAYTGSAVYSNVDASGRVGYPKNWDIAYMTRGVIWVFAETAVTPASNVYYRFAASGGNTVLGRFTGTADAGTVQIASNAQFINSTTSPGQLVQIAINLT